MMYQYFVSVYFLLFCVNFVHVSNEDILNTLVNNIGPVHHVSVIFRHGNRSPAHTYQKDPYKNYPWPHGLGQLTNAGKVRMFKLGDWFRTEYFHLIDYIYKADQVFVQSSDIDRTIMSSLCFLHGLYPTNTLLSWMGKETWQPVPVRTIPYECDYILSFHIEEFQALIRNMSPEYQKLYSCYNKTMKCIEKHSGWVFSNMSYGEALVDLVYFFQILGSQSENNLTLPEWTKEIVIDRNLFIEIVKIGLKHQMKTKMGAGPILNSIVSDMKQKITNPDSSQTVHVYSSHDLTLMKVMMALNVFNDIQPPYSSALLFELRGQTQENISNYFVTVRYKNSTSSVFTLNIPECEPSKCTFEKFHNLVTKFIPKNWQPICELQLSNITLTQDVHISKPNIIQLLLIMFSVGIFAISLLTMVLHSIKIT